MIELNNISKKFNGIEILKNVSIIIKPSSIQFLTGKSGTGKTTFLRILAGLESFTNSNNEINSVPNDEFTYVPQVNSLWSNLKVFENITLFRTQILKETRN